MAEAASKSFIETSDMVYDYVCTPCEEKSLNSEAMFYCKKCCKQVCSPCMKLHNRFFNNHPMLARAEKASWGAVKKESDILLCEQHPGKDVEMYCEDHDEVICAICFFEHRSCRRVKHLPDAAAGVLKSKQFKDLPSDVNKTTGRLRGKAKYRKQNIPSIQKECQKIVDSIDELEKKLIQQLAKLKKSVLDEMNKILTEKTGNLHEDIARCDKISENLDKLIKEINTKGKNDEVFCYTGLKKCQKIMREADQTLTSLNTGDYEIKFKVDTEMERFLSKASFGQLDVVKRAGPDYVYTVKNVASYNVKLSGDSDTCNIYGYCSLPSGQLVIADIYNRRVKLLNKQYRVTSHYECDNRPCDVCAISDSEVCVASQDHLQYLTVSGNKLKPGRKVKLNHRAWSIAHHEGHLYVGGGSDGLYMYMATGQLVRHLYKGYVFNCCVGSGGTIHITNESRNELMVLDKQGRVLGKFTDAAVRFTTGVCMLPNGHVLVCGYDTHNIVQVDPQGQRLVSTLLTRANGLYGPRAVCYDQTSETLIVGQAFNDKILAFGLK